MNLMLASGGYPWTVIPVQDRKTYMEALEEASVAENIVPFADFLGGIVKRSLAGEPLPAVPKAPSCPGRRRPPAGAVSLPVRRLRIRSARASRSVVDQSNGRDGGLHLATVRKSSLSTSSKASTLSSNSRKCSIFAIA